MAVKLKTEADINKLAEGGAILARILDELVAATVVGAVPLELDRLAQARIKEAGCEPSFLNYAPAGHPPFPAALCVSINAGVVHGLPGKKKLAADDLVGLDLGLIYQGKYYLDSARTVIVGRGSSQAARLLAVTEKSLELGIKAALPGNSLGDIGYAIQSYVEGQGYQVVRELVGHGVGFAVHEPPQVPNYGQAGTGETIKLGLVIAIEPMVTSGDPSIITGRDNWTVEIKSGELAAHSEHTVAITKDGPLILTESQG